jgi:hypothetical protein
MTVALRGLAAALLQALRSAPRAVDVEPQPGQDMHVPLRPGTGSIIDARGVSASREVLERGGTLEEAEAAAAAGSRRTPMGPL